MSAYDAVHAIIEREMNSHGDERRGLGSVVEILAQLVAGLVLMAGTEDQERDEVLGHFNMAVRAAVAMEDARECREG